MYTSGTWGGNSTAHLFLCNILFCWSLAAGNPAIHVCESCVMSWYSALGPLKIRTAYDICAPVRPVVAP